MIYFYFSLQTRKRSGVEGLIEIENPNRVSQKSKKVAELDVSAPKELSRRERSAVYKISIAFKLAVIITSSKYIAFQRGDREAEVKGALHEVASRGEDRPGQS